MEMNSFLDPILECVINHGGERAIVFSSFNPDICTMYVSQSNSVHKLKMITQASS